MTDDKKSQKSGDFETLSVAEPLSIDGVNYYISVQKITQDSGGASTHLVLKKQAMNEDGSPRGQSRQLFIPKDQAEKVLSYALNFLVKAKK